MERHRMHATFHHSHLGEEKQQMLDLNRRLETYLNRVKLLDEENMLLTKEIQALRRSHHGALTWRKSLEEELQQARLEVDAAWRDRVHTELEVGRLSEELQDLEQQRHREAQAQVKAKMKLEQSRKELEEEQRVQIWLREKVSQLEHEMTHLIQTHQEDVAHMETTLIHSRAPMPPTLAQRSNQAPNLLQLGQEYSQRAARAWQEAAEAYQGQLAQLEDSLNQTRGLLTQVGREKSESELKLQALGKEITSAQDTRLHLEKTAAQQGQKYNQEIQHLQEHLEGLQAEKEELGERIDRLLQENRGLMQVKMSLGLEVATYRALLDSESLGGDVSITDAVFNPRGFKKNYQTQLTFSHKTTSFPSVRVRAGTGPTAISETPIKSRKHLTPSEAPKLSNKPACEATAESATWESPYPKIKQDGAVEHFRPQEVHEKVTYAEPLSPPNEQEALPNTSEEKEVEEDWSNAAVKPPEEKPEVESAVSYQVESGLSTEFTTPSLTPYNVMVTEDESEKDVPFEIPAENDDMLESHTPFDAWVEKECASKEVEKEETSDSEPVAVIEPNFESLTSSPVSEYEPEESMSNKLTDFSRDGNIFKEEAVEIRQEISSSIVGTNETDVEDKLYPDGEEMDTWDSVIERKADMKRDNDVKKDEDKQQRAEPEEDLSTREQEPERTEIRQDFVTDAQQNDKMMDKEVDDEEQHAALDNATLPDNEGDEEEDSQNVSVSWRTELESDSYAQDNTLADTRPLIRYKSDDTDANTHIDESESSEGDQEKRIGEMGTWSEGKSMRFGTMEDLCEEVEEEALDEEYDLGYTHIEDSPAGHGISVSEGASMVKDTDTEEMIREVSKGHSDEETEERPKHMGSRKVDYDDELETDRLVEQELENLATDFYNVHFAQQQVSKSEKILHLQHKSVEEMQEEAGETKTESSCEEPEETINQERFSYSSLNPANEEVRHEDEEAPEKREEEDEHNVSMVTRADLTDHSRFSDFISRPDMEEINTSELEVTVDQGNLLDVVGSTEVKEVVPVEPSQEHPIEDDADCHEVPGTTEWEVLENPSEDFEIRDQTEDEFIQRDLLDEGGGNEGVQDQPLEISPDSVPDDNDIFVVKNATELLNTNENSLRSFFSSGVKNNFWVSSSETGATYQPDDAAEPTNQNQVFADNLVWGDFEQTNVVNWNSRVDADSSKALTAEKDQQEVRSEGKQVLSRNVAEGELVHSEESEVEAESWSSGEEPV